MLPNHPDHVDTVIALAKLGATLVPVNVHAKALGLRYPLEHAALRAVIADSRYHDELSRALAGMNVETIVWRGPTPSERIRKDELPRTVEGCWDLERSGHALRR